MSPSQPPPSAEPRDPGRKVRLLEDLFILVSVLSLWPVLLGWRGPLYQALLYLALAGLIFVFIRRLRRLHRARQERAD
ncbi:MAG: hypothetical protein ABIL09_07405 [Gemmatimonadota bacterium]